MKNKQFWNFKKSDEKTGELYLYGVISSSSWESDEITPKMFKAELDALGQISTLHVYVNSPGGDVFAADAMISMLDRHEAYTVGHNDGLAASSAFNLLMSMDKVIASDRAMFMTHNCWSYAVGNKSELRKLADTMEKMDRVMAEHIAKRTGKPVEEIEAIRDAETWFTAQEAIDQGFADEMEDGKQIAAMVSPEMYAMFKHPPESIKAQAPTEEPPEGGISLPDEADNGGASQPVEDNTAALAAQRDRFTRKKIEQYGGN